MGAYENTHGLNLCTFIIKHNHIPQVRYNSYICENPLCSNYHEIPEQQMDKPRTDLLNI